MISWRLLVIVVAVELVLLCAITVVIFLHAAVLSLYRRWSEPRMAGARRQIAAMLDAGAPTAAELPAVVALPTSLQRRILLDLAPSLAGEQRDQLGLLAEELGLVSAAVAMCRSRFEIRRLHGARLLAALSARHPVLLELLHDSSEHVRAQAAEAAVHNTGAAAAQQLVQMLADAAPVCRYTAKDSLLRLGAAGAAALEDFLARSTDAQAVEAALDVAIGLAEPRFLHVALIHARDAAPASRARAATLLAAIGGAEAAATLTALLDDPAAEVRATAATGLGHLAHWSAGPKLGRLLRDPSWDVRRAAGLALRTLGSLGELVLRRSLADDDRFAAEMARHILDFPALTPETRRFPG